MSDSQISKFKAEKLHIVDFKVVKGRIDCPFELTAEDIVAFNTELDYDLSYNFDDHLVKVDFSINITTQTKTLTPSQASGGFTFAFVFRVDNFKDLVVNDGKTKLTVDGNLVSTVITLAYSTARGVLLARFQGTVLDNFILPVIGSNELMKKI